MKSHFNLRPRRQGRLAAWWSLGFTRLMAYAVCSTALLLNAAGARAQALPDLVISGLSIGTPVPSFNGAWTFSVHYVVDRKSVV